MLYRPILKQSLITAWRNKYLWFFGLFAAFLGASGEYNIFFKGMAGLTNQEFFPTLQKIASTGIFSWQTIKNLKLLFQQDPLSMFILILTWFLILVVVLFLIWVSNVCQIAIVNNSAAIASAKPTNFKEGLRVGVIEFWPVFGMNVLQKVILVIVMAVLMIPAFFVLKYGSIIYAVLFILSIPVILLVSLLIKYAICFIVIRKSRFKDSWGLAWWLFKNNWVASVEMALIIFFINIGAAMVFVIVFLILTIPFIFLLAVFTKISASLAFGFTVAALIIGIALVVIFGAALTTFQISVWTNFYLKLMKNQGQSLILRLLKKQPQKSA